MCGSTNNVSTTSYFFIISYGFQYMCHTTVSNADALWKERLETELEGLPPCFASILYFPSKL